MNVHTRLTHFCHSANCKLPPTLHEYLLTCRISRDRQYHRRLHFFDVGFNAFNNPAPDHARCNVVHSEKRLLGACFVHNEQSNAKHGSTAIDELVRPAHSHPSQQVMTALSTDQGQHCLQLTCRTEGKETTCRMKTPVATQMLHVLIGST